jgi:CheY-like chemotaxis protein
LGIGLAVVKRLVEMHGGQVHASSAGEGLGSTFAILLPRIAEPATEGQSLESAPLSAKRVLVVDDNIDAAEAIVALLDIQGHTATAAYTARDALSAVEVFKPQVMLADIGLPDIDGYELVRQLRKLPSCKTVSMIALTGYGQPEDRKRALDAGFDAHLVKPVELPTLDRLIAGRSDER